MPLAIACELAATINGMTFSGALSEEHRSINRGHIGVLHAALGRELHEWRAPQVADFARLKGTARYAPGQTREGVMDDLRGVLAALEARHPGLRAELIPREDHDRPSMPPFEVSREARIVRVVNSAYEAVRGVKQPTGARTPPGVLWDGCEPSAASGGDGGGGLRARGAVQHDAGRAGGDRRLSGLHPDVYARDPRYLRDRLSALQAALAEVAAGGGDRVFRPGGGGGDRYLLSAGAELWGGGGVGGGAAGGFGVSVPPGGGAAGVVGCAGGGGGGGAGQSCGGLGGGGLGGGGGGWGVCAYGCGAGGGWVVGAAVRADAAGGVGAGAGGGGHQVVDRGDHVGDAGFVGACGAAAVCAADIAVHG